MLLRKTFDNYRRKKDIDRAKKNIYVSKQLTNIYICVKDLVPKVSYVILWLLWEKFSLSLSFSFFSPSQTTDLLGYFRWGNADCLLLISVRCRHFNSAHARETERDRERSIYDRQWEKERKRKNIIVTANPIISLMYVCVDWHVKVFFLRTYTHINRTNQQPKKMLSKHKRASVQ
jgi:hypothetical protein